RMALFRSPARLLPASPDPLHRRHLRVVMRAQSPEVPGGVVVAVPEVVDIGRAPRASLPAREDPAALPAIAVEDLPADGLPVRGEFGSAPGVTLPGHRRPRYPRAAPSWV